MGKSEMSVLVAGVAEWQAADTRGGGVPPTVVATVTELLFTPSRSAAAVWPPSL